MTPNFGVVADFCDHAIVMQEGVIVESGTTSQIFAGPQPTSRNTRMFLCSLLHGRRPGPRLVPAMAFETTDGGSMNARALLEVESLVTQFPRRRSALDLSTQARILDLFLEVHEAVGVAYVFISHDLEVVRHVSHEVGKGQIVESGDALAVTDARSHPYTQRLLMASPIPDPALQRERRIERHRLLDSPSTN